MIDTIQEGFKDYYNALPEHTLRSIGLSAVCTFTASTLAASQVAGWNQPVSFYRPFLATAISTVASTIHALTRPFFDYLFNNTTRDYNGFQDCFQYFTVTVFTHMYVLTAISLENDFLIFSHTLPKMGMYMAQAFDYFAAGTFGLVTPPSFSR